MIRIVLPRNRVMKRQQVTFCLKEQHRHVNRRVDWICLSVGDDAGVLEWWQASVSAVYDETVVDLRDSASRSEPDPTF